ncbi:SAM-dependent methyltransferase [Mycolicibacterium palauense]|uniref:SAM-dependent methyltransferase n=1 Tax=Mycolicibacterium palauense TaxID=2034511 RepID=UPI000BFF18AF|nr:cyclopropane-fatty-acyl-phospholipid synthase family protein [Mycolicibacterium palauense]
MTSAARLADLLREVTGGPLPVRVRTWDGTEAGPRDAPVVVIRNRRALRRLLWEPGELGLARAYVSGDIEVDGDLADGFRRAWQAARTRTHTRVRPSVAARARMAVAALRLGALGAPPPAPVAEARLSGRRHTRTRDRAAIAHHYDLSNAFYELLLDEHMAYSCGYFQTPDQPLHEAQTAKLDLICTKLGLKPGMRLLDVGCGWGSLLLHAAEHYGVHATGITLSSEQRDFIAIRVTERGLGDSVEVRLQDYRDFGQTPEAAGGFDAVASIEMGEHVGEAQYPAYAQIMHRALKPSGRLLLQQMSRRADAAPGGGAFIERYIAPDMHMRPLWQSVRYLQDADFEVLGVEAMREHYVRTVDRWLDTFDTHYDQFVALQGEETARVWRLYLVGGRLAFEEGRMGVDQILATAPKPQLVTQTARIES